MTTSRNTAASQALRLKDVFKFFGDARAVNGVTLDIEPGSFVSLLGPSGCGKTSTLRLITGLGQPDAGEIWLGDTLLSSPDRLISPDLRGMSMIFQSYALWPHMTVFDNVGYGVKLRKEMRSDLARRVGKALDIVRMTQYADRYPSQLSGGQQQRVALARALAIEPTVLLMDEPLSNLDTTLREEMRSEIRRLHDEFNVTTVYVTHDLTEAMVVSDRIAVMNQGKVEQIGGVEDIYERPRTRFVAGFIGHTSFLPGVVLDASHLRLGGDDGPVMRIPSDDAARPGQKALLALRPSDLRLAHEQTPGDGNDNPLSGEVLRQVYLGAVREYTIKLDGIGQEIRVLLNADVRFAPGDRLTLKAPVSKCRIVPHDLADTPA